MDFSPLDLITGLDLYESNFIFMYKHLGTCFHSVTALNLFFTIDSFNLGLEWNRKDEEVMVTEEHLLLFVFF